jgi:hypothetical protein
MQRFIKGCACLSALAGMAIFTSGARASQINWEMSVSPMADTVPMSNAAGSTGDGFGNGTTDNASPVFAGLQDGTHGAPAGSARFVDDTSSGNNGMYRQTFGGDWSADLRIKVEATTAGSGGRSIGIAYLDGAGRAIAFGTGTGNGFTFKVRSNADIPGDVVGVPDNGGADGFHMIRMVLHDDAVNNTFKLYDLENDLDAGPGVNWNLLLSDSANMNGATGKPTSLGGAAGGIELNSESGGTTTLSQFVLDWLRVNNNTALGATDPIMTPEPATLALLALGGIPMVMRRRRAA